MQKKCNECEFASNRMVVASNQNIGKFFVMFTFRCSFAGCDILSSDSISCANATAITLADSIVLMHVQRYRALQFPMWTLEALPRFPSAGLLSNSTRRFSGRRGIIAFLCHSIRRTHCVNQPKDAS